MVFQHLTFPRAVISAGVVVCFWLGHMATKALGKHIRGKGDQAPQSWIGAADDLQSALFYFGCIFSVVALDFLFFPNLVSWAPIGLLLLSAWAFFTRSLRLIFDLLFPSFDHPASEKARAFLANTPLARQIAPQIYSQIAARAKSPHIAKWLSKIFESFLKRIGDSFAEEVICRFHSLYFSLRLFNVLLMLAFMFAGFYGSYVSIWQQATPPLPLLDFIVFSFSNATMGADLASFHPQNTLLRVACVTELGVGIFLLTILLPLILEIPNRDLEFLTKIQTANKVVERKLETGPPRRDKKRRTR